MKKLEYSEYIEGLLRKNVFTHVDGVFIKRKKGTSYIETVKKINRNLRKLNLDHYAILDRFYVAQNGDIKAFGGKYYDEYKDFRNLYKDSNVDKSQVLREVIDAVLELESIGIQYTDIHARNIIVNEDSHMRLVDLDEAIPTTYPEYKIGLILDIIIECFILYDVNDKALDYITPRFVLKDTESKNVLSDSFVTALNGTQSATSFYSKVDSYIDELQDKEKILVIRKELKSTNTDFF